MQNSHCRQIIVEDNRTWCEISSARQVFEVLAVSDLDAFLIVSVNNGIREKAVDRCDIMGYLLNYIRVGYMLLGNTHQL